MDTNHNSKSAEHNRKKASTSVASAGSSSASASEDEHSVATAGNYTSFFLICYLTSYFKKKMNSIYFDLTSFFLNKNILLSRVFFYNKINILFFFL